MSNTTALSLEERLKAIEQKLPYPTIPGTTLKRVMAEKSGMEWCLALGAVSAPKTFFRGPSIEDVVTQAETAIANMEGGHLPTEMDKLDEVFSSVSISAPG